MTRLSPEREAEIRKYWSADKPYDALFDGFNRQSALALLAEVDALRAERDCAVKVAEAARKTAEHTREPINLNYVAVLKDEWEDLIAALAAFPGVPADKGGNR